MLRCARCQDLLKTPFDAETFTHFSSADVLVLDPAPEASGGGGFSGGGGGGWAEATASAVGPIGGALVLSLKPSPDASCVLVEALAGPGAYSFQVPFVRFGKTVEVWSLPPPPSATPTEATTAAMVEVATATATTVHWRVPLQESVPTAFDARPCGPRATCWHPCRGRTLLWVEALDGGDPALPAQAATGFRDGLFAREVVDPGGSGGGGGGSGSGDVLVFGMAMRWSGWWFTAEGTLLVMERRWKDRQEVAWRVDPPAKTGDAGDPVAGAAARTTKLWERMYQEKYHAPGSPEEVRGGVGGSFVLQAFGGSNNGGDGGDGASFSRSSGGGYAPVVLFMGSGASKLGDRPFVDARPLVASAPDAASGGSGGPAAAVRLWRSAAGPRAAGEAAAGLSAPEDPSLEPGGLPVVEAARRAIYEVFKHTPSLTLLSLSLSLNAPLFFFFLSILPCAPMRPRCPSWCWGGVATCCCCAARPTTPRPTTWSGALAPPPPPPPPALRRPRVASRPLSLGLPAPGRRARRCS